MTAIILSILAALGLGGGVMVASSTGSGDVSSGSVAVVETSVPGDNGGSSTISPTDNGRSSSSNTGSSGGSSAGGSSGGSSAGGSTGSNTGSSGGTTTGGSSTTNNYVKPAPSILQNSGSFTGGPDSPGLLLASLPASSMKMVSKGQEVHFTLGANGLTMPVAPYAPTINPEGNLTNQYMSNEIFGTVKSGTKNVLYTAGYDYPDPEILYTFDLGNADPVADYAFITQQASVSEMADFYNGADISQTFSKVKLAYLNNSVKTEKTLSNVIWRFKSALALGGRKFGLEHSDFGYYAWKASMSNIVRYGTQPLYIYDTSKQLITDNYIARYGTETSFSGNVIGTFNRIKNDNTSEYNSNLFGDITLYLNLANKTITGELSNLKYIMANLVSEDHSTYQATEMPFNSVNISLSGTIKDVVSAGDPNFVLTKAHVSSSNSFSGTVNTTSGDGVIIRDNNDVNKDEMVGEVSFAYKSGYYVLYYNFAFGARQ